MKGNIYSFCDRSVGEHSLSPYKATRESMPGPVPGDRDEVLSSAHFADGEAEAPILHYIASLLGSMC